MTARSRSSFRRSRVVSASLLLLLVAGGWPAAGSGATSPASRQDVAPVSAHPRLWLTEEDLPRLRSWATDENPIWEGGLAVLAAEMTADMDAGAVPREDEGGPTWITYPTESYAALFAFLSLVAPDEAEREDYARRARELLMYAIGEAAKGPAEGEPFRDPDFSTSDRSRWWGASWALTVDWIYASLTAEDKATIRGVFLRWCEEIRAEGYHHPEPVGLTDDPSLLADPIAVRWAGNNYFTAHGRNLGLMALALDPEDDPDGTLRGYLREATGAWLYMTDHLLRTDAAGGLGPEGFEYSPQAMGYVAHLLLALHTAGVDDPDALGPQVVLTDNPFWDDAVVAYLHSLSPAPGEHPDWGQVYLPAWYGDGQHYLAPDFIELFGALGRYDDLTGNQERLEAIRWTQTHLAPGGPAELLGRIEDAQAAHVAILYFLLFDPEAPPAADPRPSLPLVHFAPGLGRLFVRTGWDEEASWFTYALGWISIDHQHAEGNQFELYGGGEWLTKERTAYSVVIGNSDYHNTLAIENDRPEHDEEGDPRRSNWERGSQWFNGVASGDGRILALSAGDGYAYATGDATALYNSDYELATDVVHASRSIVWLAPGVVVVYDRAITETDGRFKRFWLNLPADGEVDGNRTTVATPGGQTLVVTTLAPDGAEIAVEEAELGEEATNEPMTHRLRVEAPGGPQEIRFLNVVQGVGADGEAVDVVAVASSAGTAYAGAVAGEAVVLFPVDLDAPFEELVYEVPLGTTTHLIAGLEPGAGYQVETEEVGDTLRVTVRPDGFVAADAGGLLAWSPEREGGLAFGQPLVAFVQEPAPAAPVADIDQGTDGQDDEPVAAIPDEEGEVAAPEASDEQGDAAAPLAGSAEDPIAAGGTGVVTFSMADGHVYRIDAMAVAVPEDVSLALNDLGAETPEASLNVSPDGEWLLVETERFDPACAGWACLAVVPADLSAAEVVRIGGEPVHAGGFSAIASGGDLIVLPDGGGPHARDLWALRREGDGWGEHVLLTADSPYAYNVMPALSADGERVVFDCADEPYGAEGTAICEVGTDGSGFRVLLIPADAPDGLTPGGALHHPDYAPDGSIVFEASWDGEGIWRLPAEGGEPVRLGGFGNDNSPCVLGDGRVVSLWLDRPGGSGAHELKVMTADAAAYAPVLTETDVADIGLGCGG